MSVIFTTLHRLPDSKRDSKCKSVSVSIRSDTLVNKNILLLVSTFFDSFPFELAEDSVGNGVTALPPTQDLLNCWSLNE